MPSLKDLTCSIELSDKQTPLQEFGTIYGDGFVETFIPVPSERRFFSIHLSSNKFIAPGIAMYVFIDGIYQCNRNRQDLELRKPKHGQSLVDFRVRQKEERQRDGSMIAREWTFEKLNASANDAPDLCSPNILDNIGCIEVIVLRCAGHRSAKTVSNMNLDGTGDMPNLHFGLDGQSDRRSIYDDWFPFFGGRNSRGLSSTSRHRSPCVNTLHSRETKTAHSRRSTQTGKEAHISSSPSNRHRTRSRHSESISPGTRPKSNISFSGVQYGSGPIPGDESSRDHTPSSLSLNAPIVDPAWLDKLVTTAVKRGVEEARRNEPLPEKPMEHKNNVVDVETASHLPGAWPMSPFSTPPQVTSSESNTPNLDEDRGTTWGKSQSSWEQPPARSKAGTRVTWNEDPVWDSSSQAEGWASLEDNNTDSWDTDETWASKESKARETASRRSRYRAPTILSKRPVSPITIRTRRSHSKYSRPRSSMLRGELKSSSEDSKGWAHVQHASSSDTSRETSDDTIRPEQSRSQVTPSRSRSKRRVSARHSERPHTSSHHSDRTQHTSFHHGELARRSAYHTHEGPIWNATSIAPSATSMNVPTIYSVPPSIYPTEISSPKASIHTELAISIAPPPSWGCAVSEKSRKPSISTTYMPPTPYGIVLELVKSTKDDGKDGSRSVSSPSWEIKKKDGELKKSGEGTSDRSSPWGSGWKGSSEKSSSKKSSSKKSRSKENVWDDDNDDEGKKSDAATSSWGDGEAKKSDSNRGNVKSSWDDSTDKKADWGENNDYGWCKAFPDEKDENGWKVSNNNDQNDEWTTSPDQKAIEANGWFTNNDDNNKINGWSTPSTSSDNALKPPKNLWTTPLQINTPTPTSIPASQTTPPPSTTKPQPQPLPTPTPTHKSTTLPSLRAEPPHKPSQQVTPKKREKHKVLAGKGTAYGHAVGRPEYMDGLDRPYAIFRFKYRARDVIQDMFGDEAPAQLGCGRRRRHRQRGEKGDGGTESVAREWTERWVEGQRRGGAGARARAEE